MRFNLTQAGQHGSDHFQTPAKAVLPLVGLIPDYYQIWEPACGEGRLGRALRDTLGNPVIGTDYQFGHDFLKDAPLDTPNVIITNPPYRHKDAFLARCYEIGKPFALLLPITALGGAKRQALYRKHGIHLILLGERLNFKPPVLDESKSSAWFESCWFTYGLATTPGLTFYQYPKETK